MAKQSKKKTKKSTPQNRGRTGGKRRGGTPPVEHQFKPGQSGNPGGRPKSKLITRAYQEILERVDEKSGKTFAEIIAEVVVLAAKDKNLPAVKEITDRTEGRPNQPVELSGVTGVDMMIEMSDLDRADKRAKG